MNALQIRLQNPLTQARNENDRKRLIQSFLPLKFCTDQHFLALRCYLDHRPEKFMDKTAYQIYFDWLRKRDEQDRNEFRNHLLQIETEINQAFLFIREINSEGWHDMLLRTGDDYDLIRNIDKHVHPTYLRIIETVLTPLARVVAYFSRLDRGKSIEGLDIWSVMQELQICGMNYLTNYYDHTVRNGIAHGGITYLQFEICYRDKNGNEKRLDYWSVVRLFDDLLDVCNGIVAALKIFFLVMHDQNYKLPRELLFEELQEETWAPWWKIEGCLESEIGDTSQLIIYARPNSRYFENVQWSVIQSGILAEYFTTGYDRYFLSLHSQIALPGWAAFDGKKIREIREMGASDLLQYRGIVENNLLFYVPQPRLPWFIGRFGSLIHSLRIHAPIEVQRFRESLGIPNVICRNANIHRNKLCAVLKAEIVIEGLDTEITVKAIHKYRTRILKTALRFARKQNRNHLAVYLPIGYAEIAVFKRDYRRRRLSGFGLGEDLICMVKLKKIQRIKSIDIMGSTTEIMGSWRINWNKAWLEKSGIHITNDK